jgi:Fur family transcriptional regulator, peroxide stress response regulator
MECVVDVIEGCEIMKSATKVLNQKIKQQGYRMTRQRAIVLEELSKTKDHPKADEIYQMVRKRLPHISFGTVYRCLKLLQELGFVRELNFGKCFSRFEASGENHQHFTCTNCCKVLDVDEALAVSTANVEIGGRKMKVTDFRLEFYGLCRDCQ